MESTGFFDQVDDEIDSAMEDLNGVLNGSDRHHTFIFAERGGNVVGFLCFRRAVCTDGYYYFDWIVVSQEERGRGVGGKLLKEAFREIRERGGRKAYLQTAGRSQYIPTHKFYEKYGFILEARLSDYYVKGDDCLFYSISLES